MPGANSGQTAQITEAAQQQTEIVQIPTEILPTETPLPAPEKIVLAAMPDANPGVIELLRTSLHELPSAVFTIEEVPELTPDQIEADVNLVVFPAVPANLAAFSQAHADKDFAVISLEQQQFPNVWTIPYDAAFEPFLAGFFVGVTSNDWRGAGLLPDDGLMAGMQLAEFFSNGMKFFCGRCQSYGPPYVEFPVNVSLPGTSAPDAWLSGIDQIQSSFPNTYYISDSALSLPVLEKMNDLSAAVVTASQPPESWNGNWLGAIKIDLGSALSDVISRMAEEDGAVVIPKLDIQTGIQQSLFNAGKKAYIESLYKDLLIGLVSAYTPVPPASFEK